MVKHDPVYGTPVFETVAGRSMCPVEYGTDARESFDIIFPKELNELDLTGADTDTKRRKAVRQNGESCVSFYVEVLNETPYDDALALKLSLEAPIETEKYGYNDLAGLHMFLNGESDGSGSLEDLPMMYGPYGERRRWRVDICPFGDSERDFAAREARLATAGVLDANGNAHSGRVFCNVPITLWSKCSYEYSWEEGFALGYRKRDDMVMHDYDLMNSATHPEHPLTWSIAQEAVFDGEDEITKGYQYATENPLKREALLTCISFGVNGADLCAANPCTGE